VSDLLGRKVRLIGKRWDEDNGYPRGGSVHTVTHLDWSCSIWHAGRAMGVVDLEGNSQYSGFEVELLPQRERILVYSFGVEDSSGGFIWVPADRDSGGAQWIAQRVADDAGGFIWVPADRDSGGAQWIAKRVADDADFPDDGSFGVLVELSIAGYAPDMAGRARIDDFIEGELQDAIASGLVGKIIARY
jgi:hypothetical protein